MKTFYKNLKLISIGIIIGGASIINAAPSFDNIKTHIIKYEGWSNKVYICPTGHKTVGGGTNLESKGLQDKYKVGQNIDNCLLNKWLKEDVKIAEQIAHKQFKSFNSQPQNVQIILISLAYNLGPNRIKKFKDFTAAIEKKDYNKAAAELKDSRWYKQTGGRGKKYVEILKNI
jgi:lysozyme